MVGICRIKLRLSWSQSLKDKRKVVHKIIDKVRNRYNSSIAETANQDDLQIASLVIALVNTDATYIEHNFNKITDFIAEESEILEVDLQFIK